MSQREMYNGVAVADKQQDPISKIHVLLHSCAGSALLLHHWAFSASQESWKARILYAGGDPKRIDPGLAANWQVLRELDTAAWRDLPTWKFLAQVIRIFAESAHKSRPWSAAWHDASKRLRALSPELDYNRMHEELCERADQLRGTAPPPLPSVRPVEEEPREGTATDHDQSAAPVVPAPLLESATHRHPFPPVNPLPDLTSTEEAVLAIIREQPQGRGIVGKRIIKALRTKNLELTEATLRRHVLPKLCKHFRVINVRSAGGYLIPTVP